MASSTRCLSALHQSVRVRGSRYVSIGSTGWACTRPRFGISLGQPRISQKWERGFSAGRRSSALVDEAPSAKAYLDSGAIQAPKNLVDVKKVLVIGSGGLSIGQAGEFDYSGTSNMVRWSSTAHDADLILHHRFSSAEGAERSGSCLRSHQSKYRNNTDRSCTSR